MIQQNHGVVECHYGNHLDVTKISDTIKWCKNCGAISIGDKYWEKPFISWREALKHWGSRAPRHENKNR